MCCLVLMRFLVMLTGRRLRMPDQVWELFQLQVPTRKNINDWVFLSLICFEEISHHTLDIEHMTIVGVVLKIFGDVSKVRQIFCVLTRAVNILHAMLTNNALTLDIDELNADVRYRQTNGSLSRLNKRWVIGRRRWNRSFAFLELLDWFSCRFGASKFFDNGRSEILEWESQD